MDEELLVEQTLHLGEVPLHHTLFEQAITMMDLDFVDQELTQRGVAHDDRRRTLKLRVQFLVGVRRMQPGVHFLVL